MELYLQRVDTHTAVGAGQVESHLQQVDIYRVEGPGDRCQADLTAKCWCKQLDLL